MWGCPGHMSCTLVDVAVQLTRVGTTALKMNADASKVLEAFLSSSIESLLHSLLTSQLPDIKALTKLYVNTPSVLATFTPQFSELRSVIRFTMSSIAARVPVTAAAKSAGE